MDMGSKLPFGVTVNSCKLKVGIFSLKHNILNSKSGHWTHFFFEIPVDFATWTHRCVLQKNKWPLGCEVEVPINGVQSLDLNTIIVECFTPII